VCSRCDDSKDAIVNLAQRFRQRRVVSFLEYITGVRGPSTSVTPHEQAFLRQLAAGQRCVVEVGVHEGGTSQVFAQAMERPGSLYLVDPFFRETRFERLLGISYAEWIASHEVGAKRVPGLTVHFVRRTSEDAARVLTLAGQVDLVFVDARHDYESATQDFLLWQHTLGPNGVMAFHDSRLCAARPDLDAGAGPVRVAADLVAGHYGAWTVAGEADSVRAFRRS
jgi:predicted O-methyltransferase YrrM